MAEYRLKPGKAGGKVISAYEKMEKKFTNAFLDEDAVSDSGYRLKTGKAGESVKGAYKKIEDCVVGAYKKVEDAFVDAFLVRCDEEERGEVRKGGCFSSPSVELTQKVMVNYTVSILRHALGFEWLGLPMDAEELPDGWSLYKAAAACYERLDGPNGERLDFETSGERFCVPLAWLYDVSPSELLHAYMLPDGGPLLRRWLGRPYIR